MFRRTFKSGMAVLFATALSAVAHAESVANSNQITRIVVPFSPGSGADTASRFIAELLATELNGPVVVENKAGANGAIAASNVLAAPSDGRTMLMGSNSLMSVNPFFIADLPYDPVRDFKPIHAITKGQSVVVVSSTSAISSMQDLIAAARDPSRQLSVGTYSAGYKLTAQQIANTLGVKFIDVPYKGASQTATDVVGNQLDFAVLSFNGVANLVQSGRLRALAVSGDQRDPDFPHVPTIAESGFPGFSHYTWTAFFVKSDTPDAAAKRLSDAMAKILAMPAATEYAKKNGVELMPLGPEAMSAFQKQELARNKRITSDAGITPQ